MARLVHTGAPDVIIDLLFHTCEIESKIVDRVKTVHVSNDFPVDVAQTGDLIATKRRVPQG